MLRAKHPSHWPLITLFFSALAGCKAGPSPDSSGGSGGGPAAASASVTTAASAPPVKRAPAPRFTGSVLARTVTSDALYVADEDHEALRRVALPLDASAAVSETKLPGPPAQVLVRDGEVWVTVRDPGLLLGFAIDEGGALRETARVVMPPDAWGLALSPDEATLVVTSPWSHAVTLVDRATRAVTHTLDVAREPRGAVFTPDGKRVYVTHLIGTALTRLDLPAGAPPTLTRVALPAAPLRAPRSQPASASLAYAAAISTDGKRLFVPRHALGTYQAITHGMAGFWGPSGEQVWFGSSTVDMLALGREEPIFAPRATGGVAVQGEFAERQLAKEHPGETFPPRNDATPFVQPRDVLYRASTRTLLVVSEGTAAISEHDATSIEPALSRVNGYGLAEKEEKYAKISVHGMAPQGLSLSADEDTLWYFARGSYEVGEVHLRRADQEGPSGLGVYVRVAEDALGPDGSFGRRLFYDASDPTVSGGLACAGCHPEGRDDGFVWHEAHESGSKQNVFVGHPDALANAEDGGQARQTPMLAGRVAAAGPYGWHGQNKDLESRLVDGFRLHRWSNRSEKPTQDELYRINRIALFLRKGGLRTPPRSPHALTPEEEQGKGIFLSDKTACASCHPADSAYTTRASVPLRSPLPPLAGFVADEEPFKVPSLLYVGGTAPYYHDGSAPTLEGLIDKNGDRMGRTSHLDASEKKALVAFLRTL